MEQIKIVVALDSKTAIRLGIGRAGETEYPLAGVLPQLTDEEREWLVNHTLKNSKENGLRVRCGSYWVALSLDAEPSDESVIAAIRRAIEAEAEERAEDSRKAEERILAALAAPDEEWISGARAAGAPAYYTLDEGRLIGIPEVDSHPRGIYLDDAQRSDPRVVEHRTHLEQDVLPGAIAEWQSKYAEWQAVVAAREARDAEAAAAKERNREELHQWASTCEQLPTRIRRAAADGIDVYAAVKRVVGDSVREAILEVVGPLGGDIVDVYDTEKSDRVPSDEAYAIFDALAERKQAIADAAILPDAEVTVGPMLRVDISSTSSTAYRSAVEVAVQVPWLGDVGDYVLTEPAYPEDSDD